MVWEGPARVWEATQEHRLAHSNPATWNTCPPDVQMSFQKPQSHKPKASEKFGTFVAFKSRRNRRRCVVATGRLDWPKVVVAIVGARF